MGGSGSGRYQSAHAKELVEDAIENAPALNISKLCRHGFQWQRSGSGMLLWEHGQLTFQLANNVLTLAYSLLSGPNEGQGVKQHIRLLATHPYYGGLRLWFECSMCKRRCAKLYRPYGQLYYRCRLCSGLTYASTRREPPKKLSKRNVNFPTLNHYTIVFGVGSGPAREIRSFVGKE